MKLLAIVVYGLSLALSLPLVFRYRLLDRPKQLSFGSFGTLALTPRDLCFTGAVLLLVAVGYTFVLLQNVRLGVIAVWFDGPTISYVSIRDDPAQFKFQLYLQSAFTPLLIAVGARIMAYGRFLRTQA